MALNSAFHCAAGLGIAILATAGMGAGAAPARTQSSSPRVVEVVAKRFEFEPARIEVTEGETIRILVRSADGLHGFGIKKLKLSEEVPRGGQPVSIEFTATAVGEFDILCSEYCGKGHEAMKGKLIVRAREGGSR